MNDEVTYFESLKEIQSAYVPVIEATRIEYAFYIGQLCFDLMQELNEGDMGIAELLDNCQEELGISRNLISNTTLFYTWCVERCFIVDGINMDILFSWWENNQKGQPTLAKIYRLILPKVEKKKRNEKIEGIKKNIGQYINDADYASIKLSKEGNLLLEIEGGL